jgi:hypothetical protein
MSNTIINPKPCSYNCGIRIYWNNQEMRISRYLQNKDIHVLIELRRIMIVNYLLPYLNPIIITNSQNNLNQKCRIP